MELTLFDYAETQRHAEAGIAIAAENNATVLHQVKEIARELGRKQIFVNADDVQREMAKRKIRSETLGNAAGSVFKGREWRFAGRYVASERIASHGRMIRVWQYIGT